MLEKDDVIGDYRLERFLGRGQFGEVWLAKKQLQLSTRKVRHALKFLFNSGDDIDLKAAEAEIDTWIEASGHPNVMPVIDMLLHKNSIIIVSEFAEGGSLRDWLKKNDGKAPTVEKGLEMMVGILRGIEHLHAKNVVHRDLKPDNILLQGNFPRITDFGISRIVSSGSMSTKAMGSPMYMSPESFKGNKAPQNDIWSAGVIMYEMLGGNHPFSAEDIYGLVNAIQVEEFEPLPETVAPELRQIVETALQKDREKRYQTAREMRLVVETALYQLKTGNIEKPIKTEEAPELAETVPAFDIEEQVATLPAPSISESQKPIQINEVTEPPIETSNVVTQPALVNFAETSPEKIDATQSAEELGRKEIQKQEANLADISYLAEKAREEQKAERRKKQFLMISGVCGSVLVLALLGWIIVRMFESSPVVSNNNTNKSASITIPPAGKTDNKPIAPNGMVYVPGGEFMMGRDNGKSEAEKPTHKVTVKPFFMDIYEVTVNKYNNPADDSKGLPKVDLNWQEADAFCKKIGKRLPTEAEWEFAARGTENFIYPWGNDWKDGNANIGSQGFTEVGKFNGTSPFGIYDLVGNAWEWTASDFKAYPNGKLPDIFAGKTNLKTIRGGSFEATRDFATTTYRIGWAATGADTYNRTGFRCAKDVEK